jgi:murein DD-endopeptidase MepM/ murein hydrolase activator NlpD
MRRGFLVSALLCLVLPAGASAQSGGAAAPSESGGSQLGQVLKVKTRKPHKLTIGAFSVNPARLQPGGPPAKISWRIDGPGRSVRVRVDVVDEAGRLAKRLQLGWKRLRRTHSRNWRLAGGDLDPGAYLVRLHAVAVDGRVLTRTASSSGRSHVRVEAQPVTVGNGVFPVQGTYSFGSDGSRFGADRGDHVHQGQDISAAEGTPVVTPRSGYVYWRRYQADGAGHYVVVRGDDGRDYVFMHLVAGSVLVSEEQRVTAGQQLGQVGNTGRSFGAHLHFEIWPDGWYAKGSVPIDPLPDLQAWAAAG